MSISISMSKYLHEELLKMLVNTKIRRNGR